MNISVVLKNSKKYLKRVAIIGNSLFILNCQSHSIGSPSQVSSVDTLYIMQNHQTSNKPTMTIQFYRNFLSKTLFSDCKWFPSDSAYTQIAQNKCGPLKGALMGIARFMNETDAANIGYPLLIVDHKIHFKDFPNECPF